MSAQKAEAKRQAQAEQDRRKRDKQKQLDRRQGAAAGDQSQSLAAFAAPTSAARSLFSPTGSP